MTFEEVHALLNQSLIRLSENRAQYNSLMTLRSSLWSQLSTLSPIKEGNLVRYRIEPRQGWNKDILEGTAYVIGVDIIEGYVAEDNTIVGCELCYRLGQPLLTSKGKQVIKRGKPQFDELYLGRVYLEHLTKVDS